jgi:hypothetical protein
VRGRRRPPPPPPPPGLEARRRVLRTPCRWRPIDRPKFKEKLIQENLSSIAKNFNR